MKEIVELFFFILTQFAKVAGVLLIFFIPVVFLILGLARLVAATKSWRGKADDEYIVLPFKIVRRLVEALDTDCWIAENHHVVLESTKQASPTQRMDALRLLLEKTGDPSKGGSALGIFGAM